MPGGDAGWRIRLMRPLIPMFGLLLCAGVAKAEPQKFSFFGVAFGMTRTEIDKKWLPLGGGVYAVSSPAIKQIRPQFDYEGRLYAFTFAADIQFPDHPPELVSVAFQGMLNGLWNRKDAGIIVTLSTSREGSQVSILDERLRDGYIKHLQGKMSEYFQP